MLIKDSGLSINVFSNGAPGIGRRYNWSIDKENSCITRGHAGSRSEALKQARKKRMEIIKNVMEK